MRRAPIRLGVAHARLLRLPHGQRRPGESTASISRLSDQSAHAMAAFSTPFFSHGMQTTIACTSQDCMSPLLITLCCSKCASSAAVRHDGSLHLHAERMVHVGRTIPLSSTFTLLSPTVKRTHTLEQRVLAYGRARMRPSDAISLSSPLSLTSCLS